jgi:ribosome recycling factor
MSYKDFINSAKPEFEKAFKFLEGELAKIRTSRASPALVEDIEVNAFGQKFPLKQLGAISTPSNNQIVIQPWDGSYIEPIEKAISQSGLGMSAVVDKNIIRLNLPLLTEEYRSALSKALGEKAEQTKQTIRRAREDAWNKIQAAQKAKEISEDDNFAEKTSSKKLLMITKKKLRTW